MEYFGITLVKTCDVCPEQYTAYIRGKEVGLLHLRHGVFTVYSPNFSGKIIYSGYTEGDGMFMMSEREMYLKSACLSIQRYLGI